MRLNNLYLFRNYALYLCRVGSLLMSQVAHQDQAKYPGLCRTKQLGVILLPLNGMLVHPRVTPSIKFVAPHLYTLVERGTVRVNTSCLAPPPRHLRGIHINSMTFQQQ